MASMGIYLFNRDCLLDLLTKTDYRDFGREVFPAAIRAKNVQLHVFDGYWEDIGTIRSYYQCNLDLARNAVPFEFAPAGAPIYSRARFLPPTRIEGASIRESLISDGCLIEQGAVIENSVIGLRCRIGRNAVIRDSVLLGNDFYESPDELAGDVARGVPPWPSVRARSSRGRSWTRTCGSANGPGSSTSTAGWTRSTATGSSCGTAWRWCRKRP